MPPARDQGARSALVPKVRHLQFATLVLTSSSCFDQQAASTAACQSAKRSTICLPRYVRTFPAYVQDLISAFNLNAPCCGSCAASWCISSAAARPAASNLSFMSSLNAGICWQWGPATEVEAWDACLSHHKGLKPCGARETVWYHASTVSLLLWEMEHLPTVTAAQR